MWGKVNHSRDSVIDSDVAAMFSLFFTEDKQSSALNSVKQEESYE